MDIFNSADFTILFESKPKYNGLSITLYINSNAQSLIIEILDTKITSKYSATHLNYQESFHQMNLRLLHR